MTASRKQDPPQSHPVLNQAGDLVGRFELAADAAPDAAACGGRDKRTGLPVRIRRASSTHSDNGISLVYELAFCVRVEHPAIPKILHLSAGKGGLVAVFSSPPGNTLEKLFAKSGARSSELDVLRYGLELADLAAASHAAHFLVLEIGPENFALDPQSGRLALVQATVCLPLESSVARERLRDLYVGGVWGYMAPEQVTDVADLGPHTDVFEIGATLFRLLTGRPIYETDSMKEAISQTRNARIPDIARLRKGLNPRFAQLLARCLAKAPEHRPANAQELALSLRALLDETGPKLPGGPAVHKLVTIPAAFPPQAALAERLRGHVDQTLSLMQTAIEGREAEAAQKQDSAEAEQERVERERAEAERKERERLERLKREEEARAKGEQERVERERAEAERKERERLERLKHEEDARAKAEQERIERESAEAERKERERLERLRHEEEARARTEQERIERARAEAERKERERPEQERRAKEVLEKAALVSITPRPREQPLAGGDVMATQPNAVHVPAHKGEGHEPKAIPATEVLSRLQPVPGDRYVFRREAGLGGQGVCRIAYDQLTERDVVLKTSGPQGGWSAERLVKEARCAARFNHPNVTRLLELGALGKDQVFMAMPCIEGSSLDLALKRISEAGIPGLTGYSMAAVAELFEKVCAGVEHAHAAGILHLDLKPQNVIVGSHGEVVVVDWGLSQPLNGAEFPKRYASSEQTGGPTLTTTLTGALASDASVRAIGTPAYMSPEQWAGDPGTFTERTDVYGLGGVLFFLLTGSAPNQVQRPTDLEPYFRHSPTPLPSDYTRRRVPPELESLCVKCLARDPAQRYPSVFHVRHVLKSWLSRPEMWGLYGASYQT